MPKGKLIKHIMGLIFNASLPYQIGFVRGHHYLSEAQLEELKEIIQKGSQPELVNVYEERFAKLIGEGETVSFAAGRMAFFALLKALEINEGDEVILPSYTCSVMVNAIWRAGAKPVFADIDNDTFGSSADSIESRITSKTKVIVAQHSFGIPCDADRISALGRKRGIFVVEDCAIAVDSSLNKTKVGNWSDAAFFSTDHSKPINTIIGGIFYTRDKALSEKVRRIASSLPDLSYEHQKRIYYQLAFERKRYRPNHYPRLPFYNMERRLRSVLFRNSAMRKNAFLESDFEKETVISPLYPYPARMPSFLARLGMIELDRWNEERQRRKKILAAYISILKESPHSRYIPKVYFDDRREIIPLRFVFEHPERERIFKNMKQIDTRGTWFMEPVICCPGGTDSIGYAKGSCPTAEKVCRNIINWPCVVDEDWEPKLIKVFKDFTDKI